MFTGSPRQNWNKYVGIGRYLSNDSFMFVFYVGIL